MSFYSNIVLQWYSFLRKRNSRSRRSILSLLIVVFVIIYLIFRKKESCWIDYYRSRLFCFVLTKEENLDNRARAVYETWGHRCGRFIFISRLNSSKSYTIFDNDSQYLKKGQLPIQYIPQLPYENYSHLSDKVRSTLLFVNEYYPNYDWYLKADDDTFIIVENLLRFLVSTIKRYPRSLLYGYRFREEYYVSGGGGYVITREGLQLFSSYMNNNQIYSECNSQMEDMMIGKCLENIFNLAPKNQIKDLRIVGETIDEEGRERFHPLVFRLHLNGPRNKTKREWIHFRSYHHNLFGFEGISETTISFHYTSPDDMYQMDSFIYDIRQFNKDLCFSNRREIVRSFTKEFLLQNSVRFEGENGVSYILKVSTFDKSNLIISNQSVQ